MGRLRFAGNRTDLPVTTAPAARVNTLLLRWPFGQTLVQALLVFFLLFDFAEAVARSAVPRTHSMALGPGIFR